MPTKPVSKPRRKRATTTPAPQSQRARRLTGRRNEPDHPPRPITEDEATRVLQSAYMGEVRALADAAIERFKEYGGDMSDIVHEMIDGHHDVIYTWHAQRVIWLSDNSDALAEEGVGGAVDSETGAPNWSAMAYWAMRADVWAILSARSDEWDGNEGEESES